MSEEVPALAALQSQLAELRQALAEDDDTRAAALICAHDDQLRAYLAEHQGALPRLALDALLAEQQAVMAELRLRRDAAAQALRASRQSGQAARAYVRAGAL